MVQHDERHRKQAHPIQGRNMFGSCLPLNYADHAYSYGSNFELERPKGKGFVLGTQTYRVKQTYGPYVIWHKFEKPSEKARRDFRRKVRDTEYELNAGSTKAQVFTHLEIYVSAYDKVFNRLEGVTAGNEQRKDLINALWKRGAMDALMGGFDAARRD